MPALLAYVGRIFEALLPLMGNDRLVIAFDSPGYGNSDPMPGRGSIVGYAATVARAIATMKLQSVDVFGYHTGSAIALALAEAEPDLVHRLVINSALMFEEEDHATLRGFEKRALIPIAQRAADLPKSWAFWRDFWRDLPSDEVAWPLFLDSMLLAKGQYEGFFAAYGYDFAAALRKASHPLLILNPSDDLEEMTGRARAVMPATAAIRALPGWTHGFLHSHAPEVAGILRSFLDV